MDMEHTCPTSSEHCTVIGKWVATVCEESLRTFPRNGVKTAMETTK